MGSSLLKQTPFLIKIKINLDCNYFGFFLKYLGDIVMSEENNQPVFLMGEDTERTQGDDAQKENMRAAKMVGDTVKSTLGPNGMDKMLTGSGEDIVVSNDGKTILNEMDIEHPAAKMVVEVAETQDEEVGDGTSTAVILAGELLKNAEDLLDKDIHPSVITEGFKRAILKINETLSELSKKIDEENTDLLKDVARTAMTGKGAEDFQDLLTNLSVKAVTTVADGGEVDLNDINIKTKQGSSVNDSELIEGIVLDKEKADPEMPSNITDANIALLDFEIDVQETETDAEIQIDDPKKMQQFLDRKEESLKEMVRKLKEADINVVISSEDIDDMATQYMVKNNLFAIENVSKSDLENISKAIKASKLSDLDEITQKDLGKAESVSMKMVSGEKLVFIEGCENPNALSVLIRGPTKHILDEIERTFNDAISVLATAIRDGEVLPGGGASEIQLALDLKELAASVEGKQQLAIEKFADSLETIPRVLSENAGHKAIDKSINLKTEHKKGNKNKGLNVKTGEITDMLENGVIEPVSVKEQALKSASEAGQMILRIDDVVSAKGG